MAKAKPGIRKILEASEDKITEITNQVLDGSKMISNLDKAFEVTRDTRDKLDKGVQHIISAMNLPSLADVESMNRRVESLNGKLVSLLLKVDRLIEMKQEKALKAGKGIAGEIRRTAVPGKQSAPKKKAHTRKPKAKAKVKVKAKAKGKTKAKAKTTIGTKAKGKMKAKAKGKTKAKTKAAAKTK